MVGGIGALIIHGLIRLFGRVVRWQDAPWLAGPVGGDHIGDGPYSEVAQREGLHVVRNAPDAGLLPDFDVLDGPGFDSSRVDARVRDFYEHTSRYEVDAGMHTFFPLNVGLWLLVKTISRRVDQLNFPVDALETVQGVASEIVLLRGPSGETRYTGWSRRSAASDRVMYTGFYTVAQIPEGKSPVVKATFPMPKGNATVLLRPLINPQGQFELVSRGTAFGDPGFYRVDTLDSERARVWRVRSLVERLRVFVGERGELCCRHDVRFWGLPVLEIHYRMRRA